MVMGLHGLYHLVIHTMPPIFCQQANIISAFTKYFAIATTCVFVLGCAFGGRQEVFKGEWQWYANEQARMLQADCRAEIHQAQSILTEIESPTTSTPGRLAELLNRLDIVLDTASGRSRTYRNLHPPMDVRAAAYECVTRVDWLQNRY